MNILKMMIFFIFTIFLSSIVNSQVYKTKEAQLLINKYESNYSNNELDKLRAIYKKHIRSADFETGIIERNIPYGNHLLQKIDIHHNHNHLEKSPVIIFIHGGAFVRGDKSDTEIFDNVLNYFARHNFTGINANYRLAPDFKWPSGAIDIGKILMWVKTNRDDYNLDEKNIFLIGHSAGAAHVATYSLNEELQINDGIDGVKGSILLSGVYKNSSEASKINYYGSNQQNMPFNNIAGRQIPLFVIDAEFDKLNTQKESIKFVDEICKIQNKCPQHKQILGHNHYSMMYHFNTEDDSIANDILIFLNSKLKH